MREGDFIIRHSIRPKEGDFESRDFEDVSEKRRRACKTTS